MSRYLLTSALPYINGVKHLGNLSGSMLPADVHARFRRMQGHEVLFICGTDEHGTPAELAAAAAGQSLADYCGRQHLAQKAVCESFGLSFDWFGRTSCKENHSLTQALADRLEDAGLIEERSTPHLFSLEDNRFLPDRFVEGQCPYCGYHAARGDQCDACGQLLDPLLLIRPRSKISGSTHMEVRETVHLYLLQDRMRERIRQWIDTCDEWPHLARSIAYKWLDEGLNDRAITRDLSWGIPVLRRGKPRQGFEKKVFYVWFDAPIGYIAATQEWGSRTANSWQRWWLIDQGAKEVKHIEFMGKDNVAFHAVSFPITLIGSGQPWKLVDRLKAFNWLTWGSDKFSTSGKRGVFMDEALKLLPADYWRWRLTANAPESGDSTFSWPDFQQGINSDLCNTIGNFVNRVLSLCSTTCNGRVPDAGVSGEEESTLAARLESELAIVAQAHDAMEFRKAANATRQLWITGNAYLQHTAPWRITTPARTMVVVRTALNLCRLFALASWPIIPQSMERVLDALGCSSTPNWPVGPASAQLDFLERGRLIGRLPLLFRKISDLEIAEWEKNVGGTA